MPNNVSSSAFDGAAQDYDRSFTDTLLGRWLRSAVSVQLAMRFRPGMHVLDLGCGTGEDAIWLAQRGIWVTATDASPAMLAVARAKADAAGVAELVHLKILDLAHAEAGPIPFDGAFSNFGALNCVPGYHDLAGRLARCIPAGGYVVLVVMGPTCLWEIVWHLLHLDARTAFRRMQRAGVDAQIAGQPVHVWYPPASRLQEAFRPWFRVSRVRGVGVLLPPSYLAAWVERQPRAFALLRRLEARIAGMWLFRELGDHYLLELQRESE